VTLSPKIAQLLAELTDNPRLLEQDEVSEKEVLAALKECKKRLDQKDTQALEASRLRNNYLENIFHSMLGLVVIVDLRGRIQMVNREVLSKTGYTREELIGKQIHVLLSEDQKVDPFEELDTQKEYRLNCRAKSGEFFPIAFTVAPMQQNKGELPSLVCVAHDLSQIQDAEEKLSQSEYLFRNLVETMQDGLIMVDQKDVILYCNPAFLKMTGYTESQLMGKKAGEMLLDAEEKKRLKQRLKDRQKRKSDHYEIRIRKKDTTWLWASVSASPFTDAQGEVQGSIGIHSDISYRKEAEAELQASLNEKEMLLKEVHHRVKNNLQVVSSLLSLQSKNIDNAEAAAILVESQNRIKSMAAIHEKLYLTDNMAQIDFEEYCNLIVYQLAVSFGITSETVNINTSIKNVVLGIDQAVPCGLLLNELMSNALKYAFPKGQKGEIDISFTLQDDGFYLLEVCDNGIGLPPGIDIYDTPTLGLQLVTTLVDQLDGILRLAPAKGTSFTIRFPES